MQRKQQWWENPLPSEETYDQIIFFEGMVDGIAMALAFSLTETERDDLRSFIKQLCGDEGDD